MSLLCFGLLTFVSGDSIALALDADAKPAEQASQVTITPHRAIYTMSLANVKNGSNIADISGKMLFEWRDVCDGWAVQQHMQLHFSYNDGKESNLTSTELTWESKDGKHYNFNIHRATDGKETEYYRGKASLADDGAGTVTYTAPTTKTEKLPAGTLFPTMHTKLIIEKALAGERLFTKHVFDGSDEDGSNDISVFVRASLAQLQETDADAKQKDNKILAGPLWPVHMAFFKPETETGTPDYEMDLSLLANGVARRMKIDYGDFSVFGVLSDVQEIPANGC